MIIASVVQRIADTCRPPFRLVGGAAEYARIATTPPALPACYVVPLAEEAARSTVAGAVRQLVTAEIAIVIITASVADPRGAAAIDALDTVRRPLRAAILGWTPDGADLPMQMTGAELLDAAGGTVWWQDAYATRYLISSV